MTMRSRHTHSVTPTAQTNKAAADDQDDSRQPIRRGAGVLGYCRKSARVGLAAAAAIGGLAMVGSAPAASAASGGTTLSNNESLVGASDQSIHSPNGEYQLRMQPDGNLVLYSPGPAPLWYTSTTGGSDRRLDLQSDGNLVLHNGAGQALWNAGTWGHPGDYLALQNDGNLVIYSPSNQPLWYTHTTASKLPANGSLTGASDQYLMSADGQYRAVMQSDGNFVVYAPGNRPTWYTGTNGGSDRRLDMQSDGNLVVHNAAGQALWNAGTWGNPGAHLVLQTDGNLVIYSPSNQPLWSIKTGIIRPGYGSGPNAYICTSSSYSCDKTGYHGQSTWGYPGVHNCTNYAAWRLALNRVANPGNLGNGGSWATSARSKGIPVDQNPTVGSIAQYNYNSSWAPQWGHVAYVLEAGPGYIVVAEDNYPTGPLDIRRANAGTTWWPSNFIHFASH
jgi:surface antigen